jgi:hypothetical protein
MTITLWHFDAASGRRPPHQDCKPFDTLHFVQRWMRHARISTTAICADAMGDEEAAFAARFWDAP